MSDIHSCSYYCTRPACVLRQRDELRDKLLAEPVAVLNEKVDRAYDLIDRFLRNNLGDEDYATFSDALDTLIEQKQVEPDTVLAEREACAIIIQRAGLPSIADAIRARGEE